MDSISCLQLGNNVGGRDGERVSQGRKGDGMGRVGWERERWREKARECRGREGDGRERGREMERWHSGMKEDSLTCQNTVDDLAWE